MMVVTTHGWSQAAKPWRSAASSYTRPFGSVKRMLGPNCAT
jgi:hypothetical protein